MPIRAVVFDLDGTLLDTLEDIADAANRVLVGRGFPTHPISRYRGFIGEGVVRLMKCALPEPNQDPATVQACVEAYQREYARNWNVKTKPYAGVPDLLDALVARGLKLAVLSNKPDAFTQQCVRELLPSWSFDMVIGASDAFPRKPNPGSALEIARRLAVPSEECLYIGDSGVDMQTAQAAGMFAAGVLWGFRDRQELLGDGAQALIKEPGEVIGLLG
ncbi:MAG TPA: HAD family hydrolase [Verrucomicrobiota bacterium]|jgi:phosphoglycolate phosphatase|nr:HAD family hydrolase [Verrucomicrobiota bacterium]